MSHLRNVVIYLLKFANKLAHIKFPRTSSIQSHRVCVPQCEKGISSFIRVTTNVGPTMKPSTILGRLQCNTRVKNTTHL